MTYLALKFFRWLVNILPLEVSLCLGRLIGLVLYANRKKRIVGFRNLKLAFPGENNRKLLSILMRSFMNFGMSIVESFMTSKILDKNLVDTSALRKLEGSHIFVGVHNGNWELYDAACVRIHKFVPIAARQKNKGLDRFLNEQRRKANVEVCFSLKTLVGYIKRNYWVGLVVDQGAEDNAPFVEFFGNFVPTPGGAAYLAKRFNKRIYPAFGHRKNVRRHIIEVADPIDCGDLTTQEILQKLNSVYEEFITGYPESYMWWFKRFKRKRNLNIIILDDAKTGHLKQSLTLLNLFKELDYDIRHSTIKIKHKNKLTRFLLELCAFSSGAGCIGCMRCLKLLLDDYSYDKLTKTFADIVISTGTLLAPVNVIAASSLGAKSVVILKPNLPTSKFSLNLIPEHDRLTARNVVNIKGVFSYPFGSEQDEGRLADCFDLSNKKKISLFIGGPLDDKDIFFRNLGLFTSRLKEFSLKKDYGLLVTTSRRTPLVVSEFVEKEFKSFKQTESLIIANKKNYPFVLGGFLALSSIVFITTDSISMISESLGMKKTTVCVELESILRPHHMGFFSSVNSLVNLLKHPFIIGKLRACSYSLFEYNKKIVKEAIGKIL